MPSMAYARTILRRTAIFALAAALAACSAAPGTSTAPASSSAEPSEPVATIEPTFSATPSAAAATVAPSRQPRPSLDIDPAEVDAYLTSSITFLDLADENLAVVVTYIDPSSDAPLPLGTYRLDSMDQVTNEAPPGTYILEFLQPADSTSASTCTIDVADDEGYVFAALGDSIAISTTGSTPTDSRELFVATSSLCAA
jgi:hypothetical protein